MAQNARFEQQATYGSAHVVMWLVASDIIGVRVVDRMLMVRDYAAVEVFIGGQWVMVQRCLDWDAAMAWLGQSGIPVEPGAKTL